ncbi:unnamed protein product [Dovyalis caffra]|uniref:Uncharacterized protein n=1 Tax=Dovyalis caffra TaxID=77055 RepID=A0AAV1SFS4_9ROSI|nr:unnamed protein product [Dovyalis caffra]
MGIVAKEEGLLKLVHPGRYVEIHRQALTAAQVLKNNPRHSITRPDVFEYPWIVVKPDSLLHPGKVFFIVPNRTIYNLVKAHKQCHQQSPRQTQFSKNHYACGQVKKRGSTRKSAGSTPRHRNKHRWFKQPLPITSCIGADFQEQDCDKRTRNPLGKPVGMTLKDLNQHQSLPIASCIGTSFQEQGSKRTITTSKVESWPKLISNLRNTHLDFEEKPEEDSTCEIRPSHHKEYPLINTNTPTEFPRKSDSDLEFNCMEEATTLKSCLRKPDSVRKLLQLRVSFTLP